MTRQLIRLDDKHTSIDQMQMIENYLRKASFWHVANIGQGCKDIPGRIDMGWLRETFLVLGDDSTEVQRVQYARVYILQILGGYLMPDKSRNLVHLRWLLKLINFRAASELNWGSVVLAILYQEMCRATQPNKIKIGGCLSLLQSWAGFCFPYFRPRVDHPYIFSLVTRIQTFGTLGFHWSATLLSRYTRWIECCGNSDSDNRFSWHLRCSMMSTKSTYDDRIRIGRSSTQNISKCGKIDLWQAIFALERGEASANPCRKGTTGPFKSKDKRWRGGPINNAHAITGPNGANDDAHTITLSDYARCVS
ncbi:hypothetical protein CXB51_010187 [Gossypium anomalum]|uniref:Aminotransferase-like plant mobile domain-containing protein n=1 Tax=Gossypium anomalum TaxID=47600 RepID=A0A8J5Z2Q7_9ROSI|nr:hypothetical protein CXB51_010187 [Gossypium anomalum]